MSEALLSPVNIFGYPYRYEDLLKEIWQKCGEERFYVFFISRNFSLSNPAIKRLHNSGFLECYGRVGSIHHPKLWKLSSTAISVFRSAGIPVDLVSSKNCQEFTTYFQEDYNLTTSASQKTLDTLAYISVHYPVQTFSTYDIPKELRRGLIGAVKKGCLNVLSRESKPTVYQITAKGHFYVRNFGQSEVEALTA